MVNIDEEVDDIEDIVKKGDLTPNDRYNNKKEVLLRVRKRTKPQENESVSTNGDHHQSVISGTQTVYVKTWGCSHNNSDSEYMAGQLAQFGYNLTNDKSKADLWLLNSCTVKNPSEDTFKNDINSGLKIGKRVVVAGCVPQGASKQEYLKDLSIVGVNQIDRVVEVVEETLKGNTVKLLQVKKVNGKRRPGPSLLLPKVRKNPLVEIIPINSGCLNQCTYCKTKHARGDLVSYPVEEIIQRAKDAFEEGVVELWLTSEDTGTYGRDIDSSLPELLRELVKVIPDGCKMRIGMTNPPYILEHLKAVAEILKHPRVYAFLHVPVQSGSDAVLGDMKREYCRRDFEEIVDFLREHVPGVTIATDIICGFPSETLDDFEETMTLCEKYKFPSLFINQFFPRPGTPAANMKRIPADQVKKRTKRLTELFYTYEPYKERVGEVYEVLVTEISHDKKHYVAHNQFYEQVLLPMRENLLGKSLKVRITSSTKFSMMAEIVEGESEWKKVNEKVKENLLKNELIGNGLVFDSCETNGEATNEVEKPTNGRLMLVGLILLALSMGFKFYLEYKKRSEKEK